MKNKTSRVSRWRYNLAEYKYTIKYIKGKLNVKADALSRAEIFNVQTNTPDLQQAQNDDLALKEIKSKMPKDFFYREWYFV